jgi:hypothetical protein
MYGHAAEPFTRERKMADLTYVAEKFHIAIYNLVKNGTPNKRLHDAYMSFHPIRTDDFQDHLDLRERYQELTEALTAQPPADMSEPEAQRIIELTVDFAFLVEAERRG